MKRFTAGLMVLLLFVTSLPLTALAEELPAEGSAQTEISETEKAEEIPSVEETEKAEEIPAVREAEKEETPDISGTKEKTEEGITLPETDEKEENVEAVAKIDASAGIRFDAIPDANIKFVGRTVRTDDYLYGMYPGTGFTLKVTATQETSFKLTVAGTYQRMINILVDGKTNRQSLTTAMADGSEKEFSVALTKGDHTVKVILDSGPYKAETLATCKYFHFCKVQFAGTINAREEDKRFYIEAVGDSLTCGSHALKNYAVASVGDFTKSAATESWSYTFAELLDADLSNVAVGGLGLNGSASQEATGTIQIPDIYPYADYADYYNDVKYDFASERTPDLVVLALGANDGATATTYEAWQARMKAFVLEVKQYHGDVPVLIFGTYYNKPFQTKAIHDLVYEDPDMLAYGNIYFSNDWNMDMNGGAATTAQMYGHPNAAGYEKGGIQAFDTVIRQKILEIPEEETGKEYVYYVSESGNDSNAGTEASPLLSLPGAFNKFKNETFHNGDKVHLYVTGSIDATGNFQGLFKTQQLLKRPDGSHLPIIVETKDFNGTEKARLNIVFNNIKSGSNFFYTVNDITLKDIEIYGKSTDGNVACQTFYSQGAHTVFDNVTFANVKNSKWSLYSAPNLVLPSLQGAIAGTEEVEGCIELRNGKYDTANFSTIATNVGPTLYVASGTKPTAAPGYTSRILIGEGAEVAGEVVRFATASGTCAFYEQIIEIGGKGLMTGVFKGTFDGTSAAHKVYNSTYRFVFSGGRYVGPTFHMLGKYTDLKANLEFEMTAGILEVNGNAEAKDYQSSLLIGGGASDNIINGDVTNIITGGTIYFVPADSTSTSNVYLAGGATQKVTGNVYNEMTNGTIMVVSKKNRTTNGAANSIFFSHAHGVIEGALNNAIYGGILTTGTNLSGSGVGSASGQIFLGGKNVQDAVYRMYNTIGDIVDGEARGPKILSTISFGGNYGQYGVKAYQATDNYTGEIPEDAVVTSTINGGVFYGNVTMTPSAKTTGTYYCFVAGNTESYVNGGMYTVYSENNGIYMTGGTILGHSYCEVNGGFGYKIYGTNRNNATIADGLEIKLNNWQTYSPLKTDKQVLGFYPATSNATISVKAAGTPAVSVKALNGVYDTLYLDSESGATINGTVQAEIKGGFYEAVNTSNLTGILKGGTYKTDPSDTLVADGYEKTAASASGYTTTVIEDPDKPHTHCICGGNCLAISSIPEARTAHGTCDETIVWKPWTAKDKPSNSVKTEQYYYLTADTTASGIGGDSGLKIHICLNGFSLKQPSATDSRLFMIWKSNTPDIQTKITICDCSDQQTGSAGRSDELKQTTTNGHGPLGAICQKGEFEIYGGTMIGGTATTYGGAFALSGGSKLTMYGGVILGGTAGTYGGNVGMAGGADQFVMYDGMMVGGKATGNGGNIAASVSGTGGVTVYGGLIDGGTSADSGGNIYSLSHLDILDGLVTDGSAKNGGNISFGNGANTFTLKNALIGGGQASANGGNIHTIGSNAFTDAMVTGGQAFGAGGNLYLVPADTRTAKTVISGDFLCCDGQITGGTKSGNGGNIKIAGKLHTVEIKGGQYYGAEAYYTGANIHVTDAVVKISGDPVITEGKITGSTVKAANMAFSGTSRFEITGGTFRNKTGYAIYSTAVDTENSFIEGGYFDGEPLYDNPVLYGTISKGYFTEKPSDKFLALQDKAGLTVFTRTPVTPVEKDEVEYGYEALGGYIVLASGKDTEGSPVGIAGISGSGYYGSGEDAVLTALPETNGYQFVRFEDQNGQTLTTETTYVLNNITADTTIYAVYRFDVTDFTIHVKGSKVDVKKPDQTVAHCIGSLDINNAVAGEYVFTFIDDTVNFESFVNASNCVLGKSTVYTATISLDSTVTAITSSKEKTTVIFKSEGGQILKSYTGIDTENIDTVLSPEAPGRAGFTAEWTFAGTGETFEPAKLTEKLGTGNVISVVPAYTAKEDQDFTVTLYKVTVAGTAVSAADLQDTNVIKTYPMTVGAVLSMDASESDRLIGIFTSEGKRISNQAKTAVRLLSKDENKFYAVYSSDTDTEATPVISLANQTMMKMVTPGKYVYTVSFNHSSNYDVLERGVLFTNEKKLTSTELNAADIALIRGGNDCFSYVAATPCQEGSVTLNLRNIDIQSDYSTMIYARGYLVYRKTDGSIAIAYSDVTQGSVESIGNHTIERAEDIVASLHLSGSTPADLDAYETTVAKYETNGDTFQNGIVLLGSSGFTQWQPSYGNRDANTQLTYTNGDRAVINHGMGGSTLHQLWHEFDRLTEPWNPKTLIISSCINDLSYHYTVEEMSILLNAIVEKAFAQNPDMEIYITGYRPNDKNPSDATIQTRINVNNMVKAICDTSDQIHYVACEEWPMYYKNGDNSKVYKNIESSIFLSDQQHFTDAGYLLFRDAFWTYLPELFTKE